MKAKVAIGAVVLAAALGYLAYLGASSSWQYYLLVDECVAQPEELAGARLRVSGRVAPNSLMIRPDRRQAEFSLLGQRHELAVTCSGPLPENLAEGIEVVVEGQLGGAGLLYGDRVITRCASKYAASDSSSSPAEAPPAATLSSAGSDGYRR